MGPVREPRLRGGRVEPCAILAAPNRGQSLAFRPASSSQRRAGGRDPPLRANAHRAIRRLGAGELAHRLAQHAEAVCRQYLSNGHRDGGYWRVGDVGNSPGRSLYVRLTGSRAGKWCDAATAEHGDLLDLIAVTRNLPTLKHAMGEARGFLALPADPPPPRTEAGTSDKTRAAQRLFGMGHRLSGTPVETYLKHRGITVGSLCT